MGHITARLTSYQVGHLIRVLKRSIKIRRSFLRNARNPVGPSLADHIEEQLIQDESLLAYFESLPVL